MLKAQLTYTGTAPGADSNTYNLFNSTLLVAPGKLSLVNIPGAERLVLSLKNSQAGTLKLYSSRDNGTTWTQVKADTSVAASAAAADANTFDFLIGEYRDVKLDWANGGVAQATWVVEMALLPSQVPGI
jgi:hypothetical protein